MTRAFFWLWLALFASSGLKAQETRAAAPRPVEVMILGTYHFGNPGADLINMRVDSVLTPRRQAELRALVEALAAWRPTHVLVEVPAAGPTFEWSRFPQSTPALLAANPNEIYQIGFRLAWRMGHPRIFGFDERAGPGEPNYWPYDSVRDFAARNGQTAIIDRMMAEGQALNRRREAEQNRQSIAESLLPMNDPAANRADNSGGYYAMLAIGDGEAQPGAELNGYWYMRNAKMFAKIARIARPGDRVFVLVGAGHRYWLTHFVENMPGFRAVDPRPFLRRAATVRR